MIKASPRKGNDIVPLGGKASPRAASTRNIRRSDKLTRVKSAAQTLEESLLGRVSFAFSCFTLMLTVTSCDRQID